MLDLVSIHIENPDQTRMIAKIEPRPVAAFNLASFLIFGGFLSGLAAFGEPGTKSSLWVAFAGTLLFALSWVPLTLLLHGICRLLGYRAEYGSLQTQISLALWPLMILPPVGLLQFLLASDNKIAYVGVCALIGVLILFSLRKALVANYGMTRAQAHVALFCSFLGFVGFWGLVMGGIASFAFLSIIVTALA